MRVHSNMRVMHDVSQKSAPRDKILPIQVFGSLAMALKYFGDDLAASSVMATDADSLLEMDPLAFATTVLRRCNYESKRIRVCAIEIFDFAVVQLKSLDGECHSHVLTIFDCLIFDTANQSPLKLCKSNLSLCIGTEYGGVVRGYRLTPQSGAAKRVGWCMRGVVDSECVS